MPRPKSQPHPITQERLRELLTYNPCTGLFHWKVSRQSCSAWKPAGCLDKLNGYRRLTVDGITYMASRLAWLYVYGEHAQIIDHIDRDRSNDSTWNLANGNMSDNMRNSANYIDGRTPHRKHRPYRQTQRNKLSWHHLSRTS